MHRVWNFTTPPRRTTDMSRTTISFDHQKVPLTQGVPFQLTVKQLDLMDFTEIKPPAQNIRYPKKGVSIVGWAPLLLFLDTTLDFGHVTDQCPGPAGG
ncbi:hypothetical protein GCM10011581_09740 [Saccharopolyspora subtropica]|uniref:Uncharacterized protein n=1 Tax=Saccharopolyspora thermophila TaxID=89367 RepID=A0A917JN79_9PSEU|nr:hypothetical protein GCM10011581_09740 [Saccharopolyspora subtropica]